MMRRIKRHQPVAILPWLAARTRTHRVLLWVLVVAVIMIATVWLMGWVQLEQPGERQPEAPPAAMRRLP